MSCGNNHTCNLNHNDNDYSLVKKVTTQSSTQPRRCTDIGFLILFIILLIGDVTIIAMALSQDPVANPEYLYKGHNYNGDICHEYTAWIDINYPQITQCVSNCNQVTGYEAYSFENYWCVPNAHVRGDSDFEFSKASATYLRTVGDLYILWRLVFAFSVIGSILTSLIYIYMISINHRLTAYIMMNIIFGLSAGIILLYHGSEDFLDDLTDHTGGIEIFFGVFILCLVLIIGIWLFYDRESLTTEIELMAEAIQSMKKLWSALVFCCVYSMFVLAFFTLWIVSALYIYSVPIRRTKTVPPALVDSISTDTAGQYTEIEISNFKYLLIYHVVFAMYIMFIFCYFGYLILSHVILVWYLGKDDETCCCLNCYKHKKLLLNNMNTEEIIQWTTEIREKLSHNETIVNTLTDIIKTQRISGESICKGDVHYTVLLQWMRDGINNEHNDQISEITDDMINQVSDAFFVQVREKLKREKKGQTQKQRMWNAIETIFIYHVGTASLASLLALLGVMDVYPRINSWIQRIRKRKQNTVDSVAKSIEMSEMITFDKDAMYNDYKQKIFPLINSKIQNLSKEYMLSAAIDKTMQNITRKHYCLASGVSPLTAAVSYNEDADKYSDIEAQRIISVINNNIDEFSYEEDIKKDIEKIIERNIDKLKKEIKRKKVEKGDYNYGRSATDIVQRQSHIKYGKVRKEGLIFTSLYGSSFCMSSYNASKLERANITRLADVQGFSAYNERFGRIGIASFNTALALIAMFVFDEIHHNISSFIMPTFIIFMVSYTIGYIFTCMLEVTVSTLLFCVIINEERWKDLFSINQGKIKQNVTGLAHGLSAMITEHQLIMQLKEPEVNEKIRRMNTNTVAPGVADGDLTKQQRKMINKGISRLMSVKQKALKTEEELLHEIDGAMKLTQYLIDVILVENYLNKQYKKDKFEQERARAIYAETIFETEQYEKISSKQFKKELYKNVVRYKDIKSFLSFYPNDIDEDNEITNTWHETMKYLENELKIKGDIKHFKMCGGSLKKGIERAFYKSFYSYHDKEDGFRYLTDILRCSFVFSDFENLYKAFKFIYDENKDKKKGDTFEILRVKDRFNTASEPNGYRDFMINVLVKNTATTGNVDDEKKDEGINVLEGFICEIQLHHEIFYNAKRVSHRMYKKTRLFETENGNEAYKYAVKYVRPVIGRFKVYPLDQEEDKIDILEMIGKKIEKLAKKYCKDSVIPSLEGNKGYIVKENYEMSVLVSVDGAKGVGTKQSKLNNELLEYINSNDIYEE